MKIFPEPFLFKDPIGWAKAAAGVRFKFWLLVFLHVFAGAATVYEYIRATSSLDFVLIIVLFIIVFPFGYLYVMRKLVLELQKREKT